MTPLERVLEALDSLGTSARGNDQHGYKALCPAHEDRNPSLGITENADGWALLNCYAGCSTEDILAGLGMEAKELFPEEPVTREIVATYDYTDEAGKLLYQVVRYRPKEFRQRRPDGRGGWIWGLGDTRRVIYHLPEVIAAQKAGEGVVICEGEKDVEALRKLGKVATCNAGGAGKWHQSFARYFTGVRVAIIEDQDEPNKKTGLRPGAEHAKQVAESLQGVASSVKILRPAKGKDVSDHIAAGIALGKLKCADQTGLQVMTAREVMSLPVPREEDRLLGSMIYRGHRIVVGGHTGHGKSTMTLHMVAAAVRGEKFLDWTGQGDLKALVIDVEQGTRSVQRALCEAGLDDSDAVDYLRVPDGLSLDTDADAIADMERIFNKGRYDIVLADPLYKLHRGDPNDSRAADDLMRRFDDWRTRFAFSLILPMHCRKPNPQAPLSAHDLFGSSTYQWGAEVLVGVERKNDGCTFLHWWKDREGELPAIGTHWALRFARESGYHRMKQQEKAKAWSLTEFAYETIRDHGASTRDEIRSTAHHAGRAINMKQLDRALASLGVTHGVTHNGAHLKKDRIYMLPMSLVDPTADQSVEAA